MKYQTGRRGKGWLIALLAVVAVLAAGAFVAWRLRGESVSPQQPDRQAQEAEGERSAEFYAGLAESTPALKEYARLWAAEAQMPDVEALQSLRGVIDFDPQGALAYSAHIALARYYAGIEAPQAVDEYRAALQLYDTTALRLELARHLEQVGNKAAAYAEYRTLLPNQPDAFEGMRRTGEDPLAVAQDLVAATFFSDALEELEGIDDPQALPLRAKAFAGLGQHSAARDAYQSWLKSNPDDQAAQLGLAKALAGLGKTDEALAIYRQIDTADSQTAQAGLQAESDPTAALALDLASPYPVDWWNATRILESQKRITETFPLYERVARSDAVFADDAAYRLFVLGRTTGDRQAEAKGKELLAQFVPNWLASRAGDGKLSLPVGPEIEPAGGEILARVDALRSIGRDDLAHLELVLASRARSAPEVDLAMARALVAEGETGDAQAVAERFIRDHARAPLEFWRLSYPRPYSDTVTAAAAEFNLDPMLIWAVMREESRFDPQAVSWVGARGLMQLMPATQDGIAQRLGEDFSPGDGLIPEPNILMGASYIRSMLDYFDGDVDLALMAYNGGAGSVQSWLEDPRVANRDDLIRWVGYGETREYLERVSLSHRIYQELYGESR